MPGAKGDQGVMGLRGPSNAYNDSDNSTQQLGSSAAVLPPLLLPAGNWIVSSKLTTFSALGGSAGTTATCLLTGNGLPGDTSMATLPDGTPSYATLTNQIGFTIAAPTSVNLTCMGNGTLNFVQNVKISAIQVASRNGD